MLETDGLESRFTEEDLGVLGDMKLNMPAMHPCSEGGQQPYGLNYEEHYQQVKRGGQTYVECCVQLWVPQ